MSSFDELDERFGVEKKLHTALRKRFSAGELAQVNLAVRWWPTRAAPTSAFVGAYHPRGDSGVPPPTHSSMPRIAAWFIVAHDRVEEQDRTTLLGRAVETMSPVPHDAALSLVDAFEFFQLGNVMREKPSTLATDFAEVWHAPRVDGGRVVFFYLHDDMRFRRLSIDLSSARVDDAVL